MVIASHTGIIIAELLYIRKKLLPLCRSPFSLFSIRPRIAKCGDFLIFAAKWFFIGLFFIKRNGTAAKVLPFLVLSRFFCDLRRFQKKVV